MKAAVTALLGGMMNGAHQFVNRRAGLPVRETANPRTHGQDAPAALQSLPVQTVKEEAGAQRIMPGRPGLNEITAQAGSYDSFMQPIIGMRDRLESDIRSARQTLPGPGTESRLQAMESGLADVKNQIAAMEKNRTQFAEAQRVAETLGAKIQVADLGAAGGKYENGVITINPYTENPVRQVLVHELTHHLETSGVYQDLQNAALRAFSEEQGVSADVLRENIAKLYASEGVTLDTDGANRELTAAYCENRLFMDEQSINRLAQADPSLFQRIRQWISDLVIRLRGTEEQKRMFEVQRLYEKAARSVGQKTGGANGSQYTFSRETNTMKLMQAEQMEREGADKDTIWRTLGLIRDTKGNWVSEIDDSGMNYDEYGFQNLRREPDFQRLEHLTGKAESDLTQEEAAELESLSAKYDDAVWAEHYQLGDYLKHDALFERYPSLKRAALVFESMRSGEKGYFNARDNSLHINELMKDAPEATLAHEIQHIVQKMDGRPKGANPNYWTNQLEDGFDGQTTAQKNHTAELYQRLDALIDGDTAFAHDMQYLENITPNVPRAEIDPTTWETIGEDPVEWREYDTTREKLEAKYGEERVYNYIDLIYQIGQSNTETRTPFELYRDTAGEIEARESANRRNMTADERRRNTPDLGWDRAVFAEDAGQNMSLNENFGKELDDWLDKTPEYQRMTDGGWFNVGTTSDALRSIGVDDRKIYWRKQKIGYIMSDHAEMTADIIKQVPSILEHPIAILKSNTRSDSIVVFGDVTADSKKVMAAIELTPRVTGGMDADFNLLTSAYGRTAGNTAKLLNTSEVLYLDPDKKRADTWLMSLRVQFPSGQPVYGSIGKITYTNGNVNIQGQKIFGKPQKTFGFSAREIAHPDMMQGAGRETAGNLPDAGLTGETRTLMNSWNAKRQAERLAERMRNELTLTRRDMWLARAAARTGVDTINWEQADNPETAYMYGEALAEVRAADQPLREFMARRQEELQGEASQAAEWIATFAKDKRLGLSYQRETMERNIRDIFGQENRAYADAIVRDYITPVHAAVAEGNRIKNRYRGRVKALRLSTHESALVQMRLENETGAAAEYIENNHIRVTPEMDAKINRAVEEFRTIYNDLYQQINTTLLQNGQEPAPFRKNYAPHFVKDKPDTMLGKIRFALGLGKDSSLNLPTDIAGITDEFRPGKKWFGNLLQREGEITDYDAVAGFDRYIETAADVITLTDSVQRLRALEDATRYEMSDEGVRDRIDAIRADDELDPLAQRQQIEEAYGDNPSTTQQLIADLRNQKRMGMGGFVTELRRYTDNLAGKKSKEDRGWEQMLGRQVYTVAKNMEGRAAANMLALNPGTWLTNFIPITQASGEVSTANLMAGMRDTITAFVKDDGFADASDFLTNREGSSRLDRTLMQRASDAAGVGMELVDRIAAQTIVRGRYRQNVQNGMDTISAIEDADAFAARLMADRSKGVQPTQGRKSCS